MIVTVLTYMQEVSGVALRPVLFALPSLPFKLDLHAMARWEVYSKVMWL